MQRDIFNEHNIQLEKQYTQGKNVVFFKMLLDWIIHDRSKAEMNSFRKP